MPGQVFQNNFDFQQSFSFLQTHSLLWSNESKCLVQEKPRIRIFSKIITGVKSRQPNINTILSPHTQSIFKSFFLVSRSNSRLYVAFSYHGSLISFNYEKVLCYFTPSLPVSPSPSSFQFLSSISWIWLCSSGWPQTHNPPALASPGLGLQVGNTMPG
jgi:hypothetical protein